MFTSNLRTEDILPSNYTCLGLLTLPSDLPLPNLLARPAILLHVFLFHLFTLLSVILVIIVLLALSVHAMAPNLW